jgi:hypothetical protein
MMEKRLFYYIDDKEKIIQLLLDAKLKSSKIYCEIIDDRHRKPVNKTFDELINIFKQWDGFFHFRFIYNTYPENHLEIWLSDMEIYNDKKHLPYCLELELNKKYFTYFLSKYKLKRI